MYVRSFLSEQSHLLRAAKKLGYHLESRLTLSDIHIHIHTHRESKTYNYSLHMLIKHVHGSTNRVVPGLDVCPPVQENLDGLEVAFPGSRVKGSPPILSRGTNTHKFEMHVTEAEPLN